MNTRLKAKRVWGPRRIFELLKELGFGEPKCCHNCEHGLHEQSHVEPCDCRCHEVRA